MLRQLGVESPHTDEQTDSRCCQPVNGTAVKKKKKKTEEVSNFA
jgi:hypothetical protein